MPSRVRVFLCHASDDKPAVRELYHRLKADGFAPWLDEEDLLPGQNWEGAIGEAVRSSNVVLVCLSRTSISKTGFVHKEIRIALDHAGMQPEGKIYLIPVRLERCEVPQSLSRLHRVDFFGDRGYEMLLRALRTHQKEAERGGVELVRVPGGRFLMGSPESEEGRFNDESPQHEVEVESFHIGRYTVTNEEYGRFLAANPRVEEPSYWSDRRYNQPRQPVVGVSWEEARKFASWVGCRLPSESEWEYAARAGTEAPYLSGSSEEDLDRFAWYVGNSGNELHTVGEKSPNAWGLYDVLGNVWEWVEDHWHDNYRRAPKDGSAWVALWEERVLRGGAFKYAPRYLRVAYRLFYHLGQRNCYVGFRVVSGGQ